MDPEDLKQIFPILISGLISADNNMTVDEIEANLDSLYFLRDSASKEWKDVLQDEDVYNDYINYINNGIEILNNDLKNLEEMKKEIELTNRYRNKNKLVEVSENKWQLVFDDPKELEWCRSGLREGYDWKDNEYCFVDPSGGPYISIGDMIDEGLEVERITGEYDEEGNFSYYIYVK